MRVSTLRFALAALVIAGLSLACVPSASADSFSFNLTSNNLGISGSIGTATVQDTGTDQVTVSLTMNAGFSVKLQGGDIAFSGPSGLTLGSASGLTASSGASTFTGLDFNQFFAPKNISEFNTFAFDYANVDGSPGGVVSADSLSFLLTAPGLKADQFTGFAIHFCTASGTNCGPQTGFASNTPVTVPDSHGSPLLALTAGVLGAAIFIQRRAWITS